VDIAAGDRVTFPHLLAAAAYWRPRASAAAEAKAH
jgi:hypothetical protein